MATIPASKARKQFFHLIEAANHPGASVTITVAGEPKVVMISAEEFEGWQETLEVMADNKLMKKLQKSLKDVRQGKLHSSEEVKKKLKLA